MSSPIEIVPPVPLYERVIQNDRVLSNALAQTLHVTKSELAAAIGLSADSSRERERERSGPTQRRMRDVVEILNRVSHWTGSDMQAYAWYRSEPLPASGPHRISWPKAWPRPSKPICRESRWAASPSAGAVPLSRDRVSRPRSEMGVRSGIRSWGGAVRWPLQQARYADAVHRNVDHGRDHRGGTGHGHAPAAADYRQLPGQSCRGAGSSVQRQKCCVFARARSEPQPLAFGSSAVADRSR